MKRIVSLIAIVAIVLAACASASAASNTKWFVCKYVGTPGVNEVLQTGNNPISVSENAISVSPVAPGVIFADNQGRSLVLVEDTGQPEPSPDDCPAVLPPPPPPSPSPTPIVTPSPTPVPPTPSPTPTPTPSPTPTPTPTPTPLPEIGTFSIATCPAGIEVPVGESAISIRGSVLLIILLNVRVDGQLITLTDALGDGSVGDAFVTPGVHTITISNAADTEVLATETVDCPDCNPATPPPPPAPTPTPTHTLPPTDTE